MAAAKIISLLSPSADSESGLSPLERADLPSRIITVLSFLAVNRVQSVWQDYERKFELLRRKLIVRVK